MALHNYTSGGPGNPNGPSGGGPVTPGSSGSGINMLGGAVDPLTLLINYNEKFKNAGTILHRDGVIAQTLSTLVTKNKPNALLVGAAGTGKTAIAEDIAYRLASKDPLLPDVLQGMTLYELPLSNIVAGSSFVGQVEEKLQSVIEFLSDPKNKAIVFIDEIHQLVGESQTYSKIAQILKPALSRGEIRVIGATTLQESSKFMDDPALNRRFNRIIVDEFTREQTIDILKAVKPGLINHYQNKIGFDDSLLETVVILADEYRAAGNHRPDTAITLLDRAMGDAIIQRKQMEIQAINDPAIAAVLAGLPIIPLTEKLVKKTAIRIMTGNAKKNDFDMDAMRAAMSHIQGQDEVKEQLLKLLRRHDMDLYPKTKPMTVLLAGNSGTGKTEITKIIAEELTGVKPITLNMTEYHSPASINRIIGSPAGYVGSDSSQELPFDCLESNPYQVILLDEFEKGDKSVQRLFMSAFDEGYIKTNRGKTVDFSRAIIIATTNAAAGQYTPRKLGFGDATSKHQDLSKALTAWFDPELLNRFEAIISFNPLTKDIYRSILAATYKTEVARIKTDKPRIKLVDEIPDDDLDRLTEETYVSEFGARPALKTARSYIESQL